MTKDDKTIEVFSDDSLGDEELERAVGGVGPNHLSGKDVFPYEWWRRLPVIA